MMKTILAISLVAASFAMIPNVDATNSVCQGSLCVTEGSYAYGSDCANGGAGNYVWVTNSDGASYTQVDAYTYCGGAPGWSSYQYVGADVFRQEGSTFHYGGVQWAAFQFATGSYCQTIVYTSDAGTNMLGCPAGAPPAVPALLP